jgi:hypothetical protein
MQRFFLSAAIALTCLYTSSAVATDSPCMPPNTELHVRSTLASAGFFANLRNASHSVSFQVDKLLSEARQARSDLMTREHACKHSCKDAVAAAVLRSTPNKTLTDYDEFQRCAELLKQTSKKPISFAHRTFATVKESQEWFHDLTQGDGPDGEELYRQCPGRCSPDYTSVEYAQGNSVTISVNATCGHARNRSDDQYRLSASVGWICSSHPFSSGTSSLHPPR